MSISAKFKELEGTFEVDPRTVNKTYGGVYSKQMFLPAGYLALTHRHKYDHMSILAQGKVIVRTDEWEKEYHAPAMVDIPAGLHHEITALEDAVWYCVHSTYDAAEANGVEIERA